MIKVVSYKEGAPSTWMNTTSRSKDWTRGLSPFFVGPVDLYGAFIEKYKLKLKCTPLEYNFYATMITYGTV